MVDGTLSVAELLDGVRAALSARFAEPVWVHGEIASLKRGRNGHVWFDLVDRAEDGSVTASVPVVLWSSVRVGVNIQLKRAGSIRMDDGVRIRILGPLDLWVPGGRLQLQMQGIDPTYTLGLLASERDRVLKALAADGIVHRNRLLARPSVPRRVALVTAAGSAAEADVLRVFANSGLAWDVVIIDARVQGAGSERSVAAALLTAAGAGVDLVALVRGGGARTDLATFDHELVARTIAMLDVPVLTGIGHEIDTSVADLVAHGPHPTPTACAAAIVEMAHEATVRAEAAWRGIARVSEQLLADEGRVVTHHAAHMVRGVRGRLLVEGHRADASADRLRRSTPAALERDHQRIERRAARVDASSRAHIRIHGRSLEHLATRLGPTTSGALRRLGSELTATEAQLGALDPARAMERGWSITRTAAGSVVRRSDDVKPGDMVVTTLAEGTITSTVADVSSGEDQPDV